MDESDFELSRKCIVILKGRREPLPKFPGQKSDFKDFANIKRLFGNYFG